MDPYHDEPAAAPERAGEDARLDEPELLEQVASLRAYAARLGLDAHQAEDLVQETLLEAVHRPPRSRRNLGGWLRTVLRHAASRQRERAHRREERERLVARPDRVEEEASERDPRLWGAIERLPSAQRRALRLRFEEERSLEEIARELERPVGTVKSHLHRGLTRLRGVLGGGLLAWLAGALGGRLRSRSARWARRMRWWVPSGALGLGLLLLSLDVLGRAGGALGPQARALPERSAAADSALGVALEAPPIEGGARQPFRLASPGAQGSPTPTASAAAREPLWLELLVVDPHGAPIPRARVAQVGPRRSAPTAWTSLDGRARWTVPVDSMFDDFEAPRWVVSAWGYVPARVVALPAELEPQRVVLEPKAIALEGRVVDEAGAALARVRVSWSTGRPGANGEFGLVAARTLRQSRRTTRDGRFAFERLGEGARTLELQLEGYCSRRLSLPELSGEDSLEIVLRRGARLEGAVSGVGVAPAGRVWVESEAQNLQPATRIAADGGFALAGVRAGRWRVWAQSDDGEHVAHAVLEFEDGRVTPWRPQWEAARALRLRLVGAGDVPLARRKVHVRGSSVKPAWSYRARTDAQGWLHVPACPAESVELYVFERGTPPRFEVVHLEALKVDDPPQTLIVRAAERGSVYGHVVFERERMRGPGEIVLRSRRSGLACSNGLDEDGRFCFAGVPVGEYELEWWEEGREPEALGRVRCEQGAAGRDWTLRDASPALVRTR